MGVIAASFGCAAVAAVAVSRFSGRRHPSRRLALMLLAFWAIANVTDSWVDPWMDAAGFYACYFAWEQGPTPYQRDRPRHGWLLSLMLLFVAQEAVHLLSIMISDYHRMVVLNALFALQLWAVATPGGLNVARLLRDWRVDRLGARPMPVGASSLATEEGPAG